MSTTHTEAPPRIIRWLTTKQVADRTGYAEATLRTMRSRGGGPPFEKPAGPKSRARYPEDQLTLWMQGKGRDQAT